MVDKPEKAHIKRIPIQSNLSSGVTVITEPKQMRGIRIGPKQKNQPHSVERRRARKKYSLLMIKTFILMLLIQ